MTNWTHSTLGQIADFTNGGAWSQEEYAPDGVRVVRVSDVKHGTVDLSDCKHLAHSSVPRYRKNILKTGDLIVCTVGSHPTQLGSVVGRAATVPRSAEGALLNQNAVCIRPSRPDIDDGWLGFLGKSASFHQFIMGCARGAASQVRMPIGLLKEMPVAYPPLPMQRRIASILSAYNDLIENNARRIAILEELSRRIYEEWFIRFRFPGHENVRMVESELGLVPEGWQPALLSSLVDVNARSIKRGSEPHEIVYVDISSVSTSSIDQRQRMAYADAPGRARRIVRDGDVIWACVRPNRKSFAAVVDPEPGLVVSTGFAVLSATTVPWPYVYCAVTTEDFVGYLVNHARGAAYPAVGAEDFAKAELMKPDDGILDAFGKITEPMLRLAARLSRKNANLRNIRDLLLPKLISGELKVSMMPDPEAAGE